MRCAFKYVIPHIITLVADPQEGPGSPGPPPYFSTKLRTEGPKKIIFGDRPPTPLPKGLDDLHPPSSPLISGSGSGINTEVSPFTTGTNRTNRPFYSTDGNDTGVDLVLIQPFLLSYLIHVVLMLTSIFFKHNFYKKLNNSHELKHTNHDLNKT